LQEKFSITKLHGKAHRVTISVSGDSSCFVPIIELKTVIPDYQSLMLPVLRYCSDREEARVSEAVEALADQLNLSEENRAELLPSGRQTTFANRVHWAKTYLTQAGLLESTRRG
jgi:hypothetical protein